MIVAGARTPIGKFQGAFAGLRAVDLGAVAIREALERAGVAPEQIEYTIMGHVLQAGQGQITARQAAIAAGIPKEVPAITVNKVCLSGMSAIAIADQMIRAGELEIAVAGGMESMTNAPFVLPKAREGARLGDTPMLDSHDPRRPVVRVRRPAHGRRDRRDQRRARASRARNRTRSRPVRTGGRPMPGKRGGSTTRSSRSRSRSARETRCSSRGTRGSARHRRRDARRLRPAFTRGRHGDRWQRFADLRRGAAPSS